MLHVPLLLAVPTVVLGALLVAYCLIDIVRTQQPLLLRKWQWAVAVLVLVPLGALAYLGFEKLGIDQPSTTAPEELTTQPGDSRLFHRHR